MQGVKLIMKEDILHIGHRYRTNMEIYSLIATWGLEFEHSMDTMKRVL